MVSLRVFAKILMAAAAHLCQQGVFLDPYLNDILICLPSREQAQQEVQHTVTGLQDREFVVNFAKSSLQHVQAIEHLGLCEIRDNSSCSCHRNDS